MNQVEIPVFKFPQTSPVKLDKRAKSLVFEVTIRETAICQKKKPLKKFRGVKNKIRL